MRKFLALLLCFLAVTPGALAVSQSPYTGYTYDIWGRSIPGPSGYTAKKVFYPQDTESGALKGAQNLFVYEDELYIVDTGNNRILVFDENYAFDREYAELTLPDGSQTSLSAPTGIYIRDGRMLIADSENGRVLDCDMDGHVDMVPTRPETEFIAAGMAFRPPEGGARRIGVHLRAGGRRVPGAFVLRRPGGIYRLLRQQQGVRHIERHGGFPVEKAPFPGAGPDHGPLRSH